MKDVWKCAIEIVDQKLAELLAKASNSTIKIKLQNLDEVCRHLVTKGQQQLTLTDVVRAYAARFPAKGQSLAESSIRNKREGANPYNELYRVWESASITIAGSKSTAKRAIVVSSEVLTNDDISGIDDMVLKHRVTLLIAQNRSLIAQLNILKEAKGAPVIRIQNDCGTDNLVWERTGTGEVLNEAELDSLRDFVEPRKLKARNLKLTKEGGIVTADGRHMADPGFLEALEKIIGRRGERK
jgi:hypothetical protein